MESLKLTSDVQSLVSEDILTRQAELCRILALFCHFTGHTLFFPRSLEQTKPQLLSREHKLMLPLLWHGQALGVLVLNGVKSKEIRVLLPFLPSMVELALENLALTKANGLDAQTGLCVEEQLYARMLEEARAVRGPEMAKTDLSKVPAYRLCMGLVVLRFSNGEELAARCGWTFFLDLLKKIAKTLKDSLPSEVLIARLGHFDFGLLFHSHGREKCQQLAKTALSALAGLEVSSPLTKQAVYPVFTAGFTFYPNDMRERELLLSMEEQSHLAYRRAKLALEVAAPGHVLGYAEILRQGGRIIELLPLGRYKINLGRMMGVQIGQRFSVFGLGENRAYKGEVIVLQARKKSAVVEVRYQEDPGSLPEAGDVLEYVSEERKESQAAGENSALALPGQKEFYASILNDYPDFALATLVLLHVEGKGEEAGNQALALA
ncbi:MAG: diguanylate cyclase, partial [Desulfovibrio sp.]|nr:diguanylate cyclase [Desulfovibrio sp.]